MLQASNLSTSVLGYFFLKFLLAFILSCLVLSLIQVLNKHCFVRCFSESITIMHPLKPSGVMAYIRPRINYTRTSNMKAQLGNKVHELFMYFPEFKPRKYVLSHFFLCSWTWQLDALAGFEFFFFFPSVSFFFLLLFLYGRRSVTGNSNPWLADTCISPETDLGFCNFMCLHATIPAAFFHPVIPANACQAFIEFV